MVDTTFPRMLRVVCAGQDIPHEEIHQKLGALLEEGTPAILTGGSGTGKSVIMLRAAESWVNRGNTAVWISFDDTSVFSEYTVKQFFASLQELIYNGERILLCLDNPSDNIDAFHALAQGWSKDPRISVMLSERSNRMLGLVHHDSDLLHGWFDCACVIAMMHETTNYRLKDYRITYIPDTYQRKMRILERTVSILSAAGEVKAALQKDAVRQNMKDSGRMSLVELIFRTQFKLRDFATKPENLRMDWDEWKTILRKELGIKKSAQQLYGVIALCQVFEIPITVSLFCRHFGIKEYDLVEAMHKWRMQKHVEPVCFQESSRTLTPKYAVVADLFFLFHRDTLPVNELMAELLGTMDEFEIEAFLEQNIRKMPIQNGFKGNLRNIRYRDHMMTIYHRYQSGTCGLFSEGKAQLALGLLYTVPKKDRRMGDLTLPLVEELDPGLDGSVLTASLYTEWGRLLADLNRQKAAEEKFRAVLDADPQNVHCRTELGRLLAKQPGREAEAERFLLEAMQIDPSHIQSRTELGRLLAKQPGRESEAEQFLKEAIRIDPRNLHPHTELGRLLAKHPGRERDAEHFLKEAIRIDPRNLHPHTELGRLLAKQPGRENEAEHFLQEILGFDPNNIQSRTELGRLLAKQPGRERDAEQLLLETIRINPNDIQSRTELGRLLAKQPGRESEAEQYFREAIRIDPRNLHPHTELGRLLAKQPGRENEAERFLREALMIDSENVYARIELAKLLSRQGRKKEAEAFYREITRLDPGNMYARTGLAKLQEPLQNATSESSPLIPDIPIAPADENDDEETHLPAPDEASPDPDEPTAAESDDLSELKIIFLGDGEAGKTLTITRLLHDGELQEDFDGSTTPGIAISEMSYQIGDQAVKTNIWDFGGQEILHSMHRMFLTGRTLYVIVLNAREDNMDNRAKYWLQNLKSFAYNSPALLVINKIDGNSKAAVNEPELRKLYPQLGNIIKMSALKYTKDEFNRTFTNALYELISSYHSVRTPLPQEWRQLKMRIQNTESDIISNDDFLRYCKECGIEDDPEKHRFILELFQDLGICFSFGDSKRGNHIVLSPKWITNAIYMILFNDHSDLDNGILSHDSVVDLLCARDDKAQSIHRILPDMTYQPEDVDYVLDVIRKYSLSYPLDNEEEFIPMLCDRNTPAIVEEYYTDPDVLEFRVEYDYLPSNMIHNLMVRMQAQLATDIVWYSGAKFVDKNANCTAIARHDGHALEIYIRPETDKALPFVFLRQFQDAIDQLNADLSLSSRKRVIAYKADGKTQYFDYTHLVKGLARGTATVYSEQHDKSVPVSEILNPNSSCDPDRQALITNIISICRNLQRNKRYWGWDENGMNCYMREMLEMKNYVVRDQTLAGTGNTGSGDGELDLDIRKTADQPWTIVEAMWIKKSANRSNWNKHLKKLLIDYNRGGLPFLIQVCYVNCERRAFEALSRTHLNHLQDFAPDKYIIHNSIPIETVPFGYEPNNLMFGAECTYVFEKGDSISPTRVCHIFVCIGDDAS